MHGVMRNLATGSYAVQLFRHHPNCRSRICSCAVRLQRVRCSHWCSSSSISDITSPRCTSAPLHKVAEIAGLWLCTNLHSKVKHMSCVQIAVQALNNKALHASKHLFSISCRRQTSSAEFSENATGEGNTREPACADAQSSVEAIALSAMLQQYKVVMKMRRTTEMSHE